MDFDWDAGNVNHVIAAHGVWPEEVVEAFYNGIVSIRTAIEQGEQRFRVVGRTNQGRILTIVFNRRDDRIRVVTAFDSGPRDVRKYLGRRPRQ